MTVQKLARIRALEIAATQVGTKESPANSNSGVKVREYQAATTLKGTGWPWCAAFVNWCFLKAGKPLPLRSASVGYLLADARNRGYVVSKPQRGDVVCFNFNGDNWPDHVGLVLRVLDARTIITIEGNTAVGNDANGGAVMQRTRNTARCAFIRYPGTVTVTTKAKVKVIDYVTKLRSFTNSGVPTYMVTVEKKGEPGGKVIA